MSRTPSPTKRSVLSPKPHNISSPFKVSPSKLSPLRKVAKVSAKRKITNSPSFQIWEDPTPYQDTKVDVATIHHDQENILQPKKLAISRSNRQVLQPLSINKYPGYISYNSTTTHQLTELYQPPNFNNQNNSLHKFTKLPNFVTPPRKLNKYLVKSNDTDDLELHLLKKSQRLTRKHQRSNSVGKNDLKLNLITKNGFSIANPIVT